ncbi:MAG: SMC family ATPase [Nanoarchaeota archaeon]
MITNLSLKNWKSHLDSSFDFSQGINCIIGDMGSGKSSIMQAISFALFGTFPALQNKKIKIDDLIMKKPQNKSTAEVSLTFENAGKKYTVIRRIELGKGTTHAEIIEGSTQLNVNPAAVSKEIERILQVDYDLFSKAVYSEQNGLDYFLRIPKGNRMQQIDKMLKVDRFELAREGTVKLKNKLMHQNEEKIRMLTDFERKDLDQKLNELRTKVRKMEKEKSLFDIDKKRFSDTKNKLEEQIAKFDKKTERLNVVEKEIASVEATLSEMKNNLNDLRAKTEGKSVEGILREKENIERDIKLFEKNISDNKSFANKMREETASTNTIISDLEKKKIPEMEKQIQEVFKQRTKLEQLRDKLERESIEEKKKQMETLYQIISSMRAKQEGALKQITELESAKAICPTCSRELTEEHREHVLKEKMGLIETFKTDIEKNNIVIEDLKNVIYSLEKDKQEMALIEERIKNFENVKKDLEDARIKAKKHRELVKSNVAKIQTVESTIKKDEDNVVLMREKFIEAKNISELVEKFDEVESKIKENIKKSRRLIEEKALIDNSIKSIEINEIKKRHKEALAREAELYVKISSIDDLLKEKQARLSEIESEYNMMKKYQKEITDDWRIANNLDTFITVLRATQDQLREEFLKTVNNLMNEIWEDLYPYGDFKEIQFFIESGDYSLQLKTSEGWVNVEGTVSGGERSLACLALRIAFSMAFIPNLKWLILDEPTHNLDQNAIMQFASILREKIHNFANQVFLITHEERISEGVTGHFYKLERKKESDEATKVLRF